MVDVNEPVSRAFSICLRFFQLGLQVMIAQFIAKISNNDCSQTLITIGLPISYILLALNAIAIFILRWKQMFNRKVFFGLYAANVILTGVIMVVGLGGIGFLGVTTLVISVITLFGPFDWALRYTNAPGNVVWTFLFLQLDWTSAFKGPFIAVGILNLLISLSTFIVNLLPLRGGLTVGKKKLIHGQWIGALGVMAICQVIVFITYLSGSGAVDFNDLVAKKLAQTFLPLNIIEGLFWAWGLMTLKYTSGDTVRDNIMREDNNHDENDLDYQHNNNFNNNVGTLK